MDRYKLEPLSDAVLEASGWNGYWSGPSNLRAEMMSGKLDINQSNRYHIYTTSQLMELFSKRGGVTLKVEGRPDTMLGKGQLNEIGALMSTIKRNEEFSIVLSECSPTAYDKEIDGYTTYIEITKCKFIKLSANSIKSKSNLGPLFEVWKVPLFKSQRRSLGLDLK